MAKCNRLLTNSEIVFFYRELLVYCETGLEGRRFLVRARPLRNFLKASGLALQVALANSAGPTHSEFVAQYGIGFWFTDAKSNQVKSLLCHLRNAFAHCLVTRETIGKTSYFVLSDDYRGKPTMLGKLPVPMLPRLVAALKSSELRQ